MSHVTILMSMIVFLAIIKMEQASDGSIYMKMFKVTVSLIIVFGSPTNIPVFIYM